MVFKCLVFMIKALVFIVGGGNHNAMQYSDDIQINVSQKPGLIIFDIHILTWLLKNLSCIISISVQQLFQQSFDHADNLEAFAY